MKIHPAILEKTILEYPEKTDKEMAEYIKKTYNIEITPDTVQKKRKKMGISRKRGRPTKIDKENIPRKDNEEDIEIVYMRRQANIDARVNSREAGICLLPTGKALLGYAMSAYQVTRKGYVLQDIAPGLPKRISHTCIRMFHDDMGTMIPEAILVILFIFCLPICLLRNILTPKIPKFEND